MEVLDLTNLIDSRHLVISNVSWNIVAIFFRSALFTVEEIERF